MKSWFTCAFFAATVVALAASSASAQYADAVLADNPFAYYRMQELNAGHVITAANSSTQAGFLDGTYFIHGGVNGSFANIDSPGFDTSPGKQFNRVNSGAGAYVVSDQPAAVGSLDAFTMSFLVRPEDYSSNEFEALYATVGFGAGAVHLTLVPTGHASNGTGSAQLEFAVAGTAGTHPRIDLESLLALDEWGHVAVTYERDTGANENTLNFFVNGDLIDSVTRAGSPAANFDARGDIGSWNGDSRFFQGGFDEFAIFDTALSADQIRAQANALVPEPTSVAVWTLLGLAAVVFGAWKQRIANR